MNRCMEVIGRARPEKAVAGVLPKACGTEELLMQPDPGSDGRHACLGMWTDLLEPSQILEIYERVISGRRRLLVGFINLHTVFCHKRSDAVREFFARADLVYVDGMPVVWWLRCLGKPARAKHRATFVDWLPLLLECARDRRWRVYYLGNRPGVTADVAAQFRARLPGLQIRTHHGHFDHNVDSPDNRQVVEDINRYAPDVLLVGMGTPLQERWIVANADRLNASVIHPCGATADYFAGVVPCPPRVLGRLGLEGLYRAMCEPRRLWRRYLVEPLLLLDLALRDLHRAYVRRRAHPGGGQRWPG